MREHAELQAEHAALKERVEDLQTERDHAEARADDLQRQLQAALKRREETQELVRYVEDERTAEQRRREAGLLTRSKWWLFGRSTDEEGES